MNYDNKFDKQWQNEGTAPTDSYFESTGGFKGGVKPPAQWFNWFWHKVIAAITELQTKLSTVDTSKADKKNSNNGFEGGLNANATSGGAVGSGAKTSEGFAGGYNATTLSESGSAIDAIQLGEGNNNSERTLKVYGYTMMNIDGKIPNERMKSLIGLPVARIAYLKIDKTISNSADKTYTTGLTSFSPNECVILRIRDNGTAGVLSLSSTTQYVYSMTDTTITFLTNGNVKLSTNQASKTLNVEFLIISKSALTLTELTS